MLEAFLNLVLAGEHGGEAAGAAAAEHAGEAAAHAAPSAFAQHGGSWLHPIGKLIGICHEHHNCWVLVAIGIAVALSGFFVIATRRMETVPGRLQNAAEWIVEGFNNFTRSIIGDRGVKYAPIIGAFFLYIVCMNLIGLIPGMVSPTANPNVTVSLALTAFLIAQGIAVKENGIAGYLNHLAQEPNTMPKFLWLMVPLFFAIHVIGEIAKPISLSMRLLGNIFGEDTVLVALATLGVSIGLPSLFKYLPFQFPIQVLALMTSVIQALVFSALLAVYISLVMPHEHHEEHEGGQHGHAH